MLFRFVIDRGTLVAVFFMVLCLFGVIAALSVPVQMTPNIERPLISVVTYWPGATSLDVEQEILIEQEEFLQKVRGVNRIVSEAKMGSATIDLEFALNANMEEALLLVNNALSQVTDYPENVDQPRIAVGSATNDPFIFLHVSPLAAAGEAASALSGMDWLEDNVGAAIERIPGVASTTFVGGTRREVRISIDPARLAAQQLSLREVRDAIRRRNRDSSGGDIDAGKRRYVVRTIGRFQSVEDIEQTIVAERRGSPVLLRDIGTAEMAESELQRAAYMNGERTLIFFLRRESGTNVIELKQRLDVELQNLNDTVLAARGLYADIYADDVGYVVEAIKVVQKNLVLGALLACLVLYLFLRSLPVTLLGALGVPICAMGAFLGLLLMGRTINVISLAGVAFALGMTLDNSIVVLENIYRQRLLGKKARQASLDGVQDVWKAVLASTLTTVFVFLPIALVGDEAGQLDSDIAIAISAAILLSMLVAVTLIPPAAARINFTAASEHGMLASLAGRLSGRLFRFLDWLLQGWRRPLAFVAGVFALAFLVLATLTPKVEYLPEGEEPKIFAFMFPPPGHNLAEMQRIGKLVDERLQPALDAPLNSAYTPDGFPPLDYVIRWSSAERIFTVAESKSNGRAETEALKLAMSNLFGEFPGMIAFANRGSLFSGNSGGTRAIALDISGPDLQEVYRIAARSYAVAQQAFKKPQIRPEPGLTLSQPGLEIRPDWLRARELGLGNDELGYMVWALGNGAWVDEFYLADEKIDMYFYGSAGAVHNPEDIAELPVYSASGAVVPLSSIAQIEQTLTANEVRRVDGKRTVTLTIIPPADVALEQAVEIAQQQIIAAVMSEANYPAGVELRIGGASDKLSATREALSGNFFIALLLAYLLLVAIFSHWLYPLLVMLTLPLGISGGIAGLWLMNHVIGIR
ncbi:MAG: efflux RND transporter permease subunit, partial [Pseudomonadales bacterium]